MKWPSVTLGNLAIDMQPGFAQQPDGDDRGLPHLRTNNVSEDGSIDLSSVKTVTPSAEQRDKYSLQPFDILFNNTNSPALVGKTALFTQDGEFLFSNHMTRIRVHTNLANPAYVARYLHWVWRTGGFRGMVTQWVSQAAINRTQLAKLQVPLPPLSEQRRIVEILDQADALRRKRAEADAKAARILPALFYQMFGDPATNPMGWPRATLGNVIVEAKYGTSVRAASESGGIAVLRMNNIASSGHLDLRDLKYAQLPDEERMALILKQGDLLFNRTNSRELVGKTGLWTESIEAVPASYLIRVRVDRQQVIPEYVWAYMNTRFMKQVLFERARRAIGMANINAQELRSLPFIKPPIETQKEFAQQLASLAPISTCQAMSAECLQTLFSGLLFRAFSSDLTAKWREAHMKELLAEMKEQTKLLAAVRSSN